MTDVFVVVQLNCGEEVAGFGIPEGEGSGQSTLVIGVPKWSVRFIVGLDQERVVR